jgi:mannose-1-phosphate guanylyltransferase
MLEEAAAFKAGPPSSREAACGPGGEVAARGAKQNPVTIRGIVLAGVHSWGDCVLERAVCRPLLPVATKPLITHALTWLRDSGIPQATICGNSDTHVLRGRLGDGKPLNLNIDYFEDVMPRGPAGCVRDAAIDTDADAVVVVDGTLVPRIDLPRIVAEHVCTDAAVTMVVAKAAGGAHEPIGIYIFARRVLAGIPDKGYQDIKESLIPKLYERGERVATHVVEKTQAARVTDASSYLSVNMWATEHNFAGGALPADRPGSDEACIDGSAHVDPTARFVGPVIVGPNAVIGPGALVVGPSTIGAGSRIGADAVVSRSAIWERCHVGPGAIVDQCVLVDGARAEAEYVVRETVCFPRD